MISRTLHDLHFRASLIKQEFGEDVLNEIRTRFHAWIVFTEDEAEASLVFAKGIAYLGLTATIVNATVTGRRGQTWYLGTPRDRENPSFIFFSGHVPVSNIYLYDRNVPLGKVLIPLSALATGEIHYWDVIRQMLLPLPPGADLAFRTYFELAASLVDVPPDDLGNKTSAQIGIR